MTALCAGGGTSSQKPGYDRLLSVAPWVIAGLITDIPPLTAAAIGGAIGNTFYDLQSFCISDPPAMPSISITDIVAVLNPQDQVAFAPAAQKFRDLVANYAWRAFCQCDAGAVPAPVVTPPALLQYNPQPSAGPAPLTSGHCFDQSTYSVDVKRDASTPLTNGSQQLWPITQRFLSTPGPGGTITGWSGTIPTFRIPAVANAIRVRGHNYTDLSGRLSEIAIGALTFNASGANVGGFGGIVIHAGTGDWDSLNLGPTPITGTSLNVAVYFNLNSGDPTVLEDVELIFDCAGTAASQVQPCCPPDTSLQASINQILGYVQLMQRQLAPFAYIPHSSHTVTGTGQFAVQGLLGVKVTLDAFGSAVGSMSGDPAEFFEAGWFSWGGADGFTSRKLITHSPQVDFPAAAGQYTQIGYTLGQGVTATFQELVREP